MINQLATLVHVTTQRPHMPGLNPVNSDDFLPPSNWEELAHNYPQGGLVGPVYQGCLTLIVKQCLVFAIFAQEMELSHIKEIIAGIYISNDAISLSFTHLQPSQPNQPDTMAITIWLVVSPSLLEEVRKIVGSSFTIHRSLGSSLN
jgi:hypothetical protein